MTKVKRTTLNNPSQPLSQTGNLSNPEFWTRHSSPQLPCPNSPKGSSRNPAERRCKLKGLTEDLLVRHMEPFFAHRHNIKFTFKESFLVEDSGEASLADRVCIGENPS